MPGVPIPPPGFAPVGFQPVPVAPGQPVAYAQGALPGMTAAAFTGQMPAQPMPQGLMAGYQSMMYPGQTAMMGMLATDRPVLLIYYDAEKIYFLFF